VLEIDVASEREMKKRLLVTGASGLLGSKIAKIAREDYEVIPLYGSKPLNSNALKLDITEREQVFSLFKKVKLDTVIHTASETNVDKCEIQKDHALRVNVEGTRNVASACSKLGAKLIYISTDYVFDGEKGNYTEQDKPNPINYYGVTKLEGEKQVTQNCQKYFILRASVLYGWHPWKHVIAICYTAKKVGGQIKAGAKEGNANFFKINYIPEKLAFDHAKMMKDYISGAA